MTRITKRLSALPAERALEVIAGRWKAVLLHRLFAGPQRLSELQRAMPGIAQKVLIQQLRQMEEHGLVSRAVFAEVPVRVEYTATELGSSLAPILAALCDWGRRHAAALDEIDRLADCRPRPVDAEPIAYVRSRDRTAATGRSLTRAS